jgi:hypothetical protein
MNVVIVIVEEGITKIKRNTFYKREQLKSIIFPQSLEKIEDFAVASCTSLQSVFIPKNVTKIANEAFAYCYALHEVIFEKGSKLKSISQLAFHQCTSLKIIYIPKSVTTLGNGVFSGCCGLESVIFDEGSQLKAIPRYCFSNCFKLKALLIPDAVTTILDSAFYHCCSLRSVYFSLKSNLKYIEEGAFDKKCLNLHFINVPSTVISVPNTAFDQWGALPITSTVLDLDQIEKWFKHGYDKFPLHQLSFRHIHAMTQDKLDDIPPNDPSLIQQDEFGLTPLHIVCSNPHTNTSIIKQIYNKHPDAATLINAKNMTPWHIYLVMKGVIVCKEFDAISYGDDQYEWLDEKGREDKVTVSEISKVLLKKDTTLNSIHNLIAMGLDCDVWQVTLALHGVPSFENECNRSNGTTGWYPFMAIAASSDYNLCHLYEMTMKTCVHNIQRQPQQSQTLGKRKTI